MIIILGPTASGKTSLAVQLAYDFNGEIISADSRQIYKGMDIGTGKDLGEYTYNNQKINYHLIDIVNPSIDYSVYRFKQDYELAYQKIINKNKNVILCGGTGLYIESILLNYQMMDAPPNSALRNKLSTYTLSELKNELLKINNDAFDADYHTSKRRIIRSIEILLNDKNAIIDMNMKNIFSNEALVIGIKIERADNLKLINKRLLDRLNSGMIDEVENLIDSGISIERLKYFGLEYKFIGQYLDKEISYDNMVETLNIGINRFSKRQMTFFRRMEKRGIKIHWLNRSDYIKVHDLVDQYYNK